MGNQIEKRFMILRTAIALVLGVLLASLIIFFTSDKPLETLIMFLTGPVTSVMRARNTIETMIPLLFTGTGVCLMYSANQSNMAAEGAFFLGGIAASFFAIKIALPAGIHPVLCIAAGGIAGALVCFIPGILFVKRGALPVVSSLMMNYVAFFLGIYFINYIMGDPSAGFPSSLLFNSTARLPKMPRSFGIFGVHIGLFIAIAVIILGYIYLYKSKWGYEIRSVGKNVSFVRYSGINVNQVILSCQILGGMIAGIGGAVEQLGMFQRFQYQQLSGHGFDGIIVAIIARYNPKYLPLSCLFLAYIRIGADAMSRNSNVPVEIISLIQAIIIILVCAESFLSRWKHREIVRMQRKEAVKGAAS